MNRRDDIHVVAGEMRSSQTTPQRASREYMTRWTSSRYATRLDAWAEKLFALSPEPEWWLVEPNAKSGDEQDIEARLAISNGAFGMRASLEHPLLGARPATLVAGLFEPLQRDPAVPALVSAPDWLRLNIRINDELIDPGSGETLVYWRALDLRRGILVAEWRQRAPGGRVVRVQKLRLASLARRALAVQLARIALEQPGVVTVETATPAPATLQVVESTRCATLWRTPSHSGELALATLSLPAASRRATQNQGAASSIWSWSAAPAQPRALARMMTLVRGNKCDEHPTGRAVTELRTARRQGLPKALDAHIGAWKQRWAASDVEVDGDASAQQALRFAIYHLNSVANPDDERVSIGARGLTGEGYLGHVFWDTEIFLLPFYTLTWPRAARALLMYRYHTLPAARAKAARIGYRGAMYAWESADTGEEVTPPWAIGRDGRVVPILCGTQEQHISADIAYAVWQYWQATRDVGFLLKAGAEIILETARFWASRAVLEADGRYHIRQVIGPDEYHESIDDNAYTNSLAAWNLDRGLLVAALLRTQWPKRWSGLRDALDLSQEELDSWRQVAEHLTTGFDLATGLIEQFAGFFDLEDVDLSAHGLRTVPIDVVLGAERTRRAQVIKQADVLMLLTLLPCQYDTPVQLANFRYYEPRCGHGSSLSPATHALLAARVADIPLAERYFQQAASIDLADTRGDTALGVHIGALGGLWQAAVFGFGGLRLNDGGLRLDPRLPANWQRLAFRLRWRGRQLRIEACSRPSQVSAWLEHGRPLRIDVRGDRRRVARDTPVVWREDSLT